MGKIPDALLPDASKAFHHMDYRINFPVPVPDIIALYNDAGLPRPTDDAERIGRMYANSNLIISAWEGDLLVGIARSLTDFSFCCYLSDLAVRKDYQRSGVGRELVARTRAAIGPESMLLLLSVPGAMGYYPKIGMETVQNGFIYKRER